MTVDDRPRQGHAVLDLPSRGDTCFPDHRDLGGGRHEIWNYSSPVDGPDLEWLEGQKAPTNVYRVTVAFP